MRFEVSERIDTEAGWEKLTGVAEQQFEKISRETRWDHDCLVVTGIEATFGSINRSDRTVVAFRELDGGWLVSADVIYRPSVWFWIFVLLSLFTYVGWLIPIAFYLIQRNTVRSAAEAALRRVANELRSASGSKDLRRVSALDELEKLGNLKERGFVSEEEFQAKKAHLLGG